MRFINKIVLYPIIISSVLMTASCSREVTENPFFDKDSSVATPCLFEGDTNIIIIRDYFPKIGKINRVSSRDYKVLPLSRGIDTVMVIATPSVQSISTLEVEIEGEKGSIVIMRKEKGSGNVPAITTTSCDGAHKNFLVRVENAPANYLILWQNTNLDSRFIEYKGKGAFIVTIPDNASRIERSFIRIYAANAQGVGNDILIPLQYGKVIEKTSLLKRSDFQKQIMYSLMIDRFYNGNPQNDWKIHSKNVLDVVDYYGGDLSGVTMKIKDGYFDTLGVNTIWLSPITENPKTAWGLNKDPYTKFTGYHGYWPLHQTVVDSRFGTPDELRELLAEAHKHGDNVILDYVSNHVHIDNPIMKQHPDWTTPSTTPDGRPNFELWDEFRLTTWFDKHIPSLDLEREDVNEPMSDSALFWMQNYDFDGFRHDATKHIPEVYWRKLTKKMLDSIPSKTLFQIGETYGSPELISSYIKTGMIDGQFDFNVYDGFINATLDPDGSFSDLGNTLRQSLDTYGYHNLMGYITGNHDRARYISIVGGDLIPGEDYKMAGWKRKIGISDSTAYDKLSLLHAFIFTLPGIPCVYYGDEWGQPGANDPDNRRPAQFEPLNQREAQLNEKLRRLIHLRSESMPLLYGDYYEILREKDLLIYMRSYIGDYAIVVLNKSPKTEERIIDMPFGLKYDNLSSFGVKVKPYSYLILTPKHVF